MRTPPPRGRPGTPGRSARGLGCPGRPRRRARGAGEVNRSPDRVTHRGVLAPLGQLEVEGRPAPDLALEADAPAEPLDDRLADAEAEAASLAPGRRGGGRLGEPVEDPGPKLLGNAGSAVAHADAHEAG